MADPIITTETILNSEPIDEMVQHLQKNYVDKAAEIIDLPLFSDLQTRTFKKRVELEQWILDPANNVSTIIAFSGGKDSIAMVLKALDMGIPKERIELWHHDIDGEGEDLFDWKCTKSYCIAFAKAFGVKILFSYRKGGIVREIYKNNELSQPVFFQKEMGGEFFTWTPKDNPEFYNTRLKFPSVGADLQTRWCSYQVKIDVMQKAITHSERFDNANIVIMTGERRDESKNRGKYAEIEKYRGASSTRRAIVWRSIIDWSERDVWDAIERYKVQPHPCYELGWGRCSCQLCIFSSANTWASIEEINKRKVARIAEIEKDLKIKSEEIIASGKPFVSIPSLYNEYDRVATGELVKSGPNKGQEKFTKGRKLDNVYEARVNRGHSFITEQKKARWLAEAQGEFVSPIFVDKWELPAGAFNGEGAGAN
jgi:3'-phosphoadenosine 5'-phosphosulfate sulfotransferase (PAPS reductase)/FAD synthetase